MNEDKFGRWLDNHIDEIKTALLSKTATADLPELRYTSGQLHEALIIRTIYKQLRKEDEYAQG